MPCVMRSLPGVCSKKIARCCVTRVIHLSHRVTVYPMLPSVLLWIRPSALIPSMDDEYKRNALCSVEPARTIRSLHPPRQQHRRLHTFAMVCTIRLNATPMSTRRCAPIGSGVLKCQITAPQCVVRASLVDFQQPVLQSARATDSTILNSALRTPKQYAS